MLRKTTTICIVFAMDIGTMPNVLLTIWLTRVYQQAVRHVFHVMISLAHKQININIF